jgi:hypothetical protein
MALLVLILLVLNISALNSKSSQGERMLIHVKKLITNAC